MSDVASSRRSTDNDETVTMFKCRKCDEQLEDDEDKLEEHRQFHRQERARQRENRGRRGRASSPSQSEGTIFTRVANGSPTKRAGSKKRGEPEGKKRKEARRKSKKNFNKNTAAANKGKRVSSG